MKLCGDKPLYIGAANVKEEELKVGKESSVS